MPFTDIDNLTLPELCELLVIHTTELLNLMNQKGADGYLLRDRKKDVETIQVAILKKKTGSARLSTFPVRRE